MLLGSPYRSGRSVHWVKVKNPKASAVKREAEEDWESIDRFAIFDACSASMSHDWAIATPAPSELALMTFLKFSPGGSNLPADFHGT
jgi:hypothetical protein